MKKHLYTAILIIVAVAVTACPIMAAGDFIINDGVLTEYTGTAPVVTVPDGVERIASGAFTNSTDLLRVTIQSRTCTFDTGAIPSGVTVRAYAGSAAEIAALRDGLPFSAIEEKKYTLTVNFLYSDGSTAHESAAGEYASGESYSVSVPSIAGFTPDRDTVAGTMGSGDVTVNVYYSQNVADGWKFENGRIRYYLRDSYIAGTSRNIDGNNYSFDSNGYLSNSGFTVIGSNTYYLDSGVCASGYRMIDGGIYCFATNGTMFAGTSHDGYEFDINGRLIGDKIMVTISGKTYYMVNNTLMSGFVSIGNQIYYFDSDLSMVKGTSGSGYSFDSEGRLISGITASELDVSPISAVSADGSEKRPQVTVKFKGITLTENVHYTLKYSDNVEPGEGKIEIIGMGPVSGSSEYKFQILGAGTFTLTIKYVNTMGMSVAPIYTTQDEPGSEFSVPSPEVDGYTPDQKTASGTMGNSDMTITITYSKVSGNNASEESGTGVETSAPETSAAQNSSDESDGNVKYNYSLLLKVIAGATILAGGAIVVIINWDLIKKLIDRKIAKIKAKKGGKADADADSSDADEQTDIDETPDSYIDEGADFGEGDSVAPHGDIWDDCKSALDNTSEAKVRDAAFDRDFWNDDDFSDDDGAEAYENDCNVPESDYYDEDDD